MPEWRTSTWGEEISLEYGKALRGYGGAEGPVPVYGTNGPIGWTTEPLAPGPGVILGRKGAYRGVHFSSKPFFVIDTAYYAVPKTKLEMRWLYYAMIHHKLGEIDDGSPIPSTTRAAVYPRELEVPEITEQRAIAAILGSLDDKIELNWRMNETLEATAQVVFANWLETANPSSRPVTALVADGLLEIGDGYRAKNSELQGGGIPFLRAANLNDGFDLQFADVLLPEFVLRAGTKRSQIGDIAFTSKGTIGRVAQVSEFVDPFVYSPQICFWRSLAPRAINPNVLYVWMKSRGFSSQVATYSGQTDMAPYVSLRDQLRIEVPDLSSSQPIVPQITSLLDRAHLSMSESNTLAKLRDLLLPKLMRGEIPIQDAEKFVGKTGA